MYKTIQPADYGKKLRILFTSLLGTGVISACTQNVQVGVDGVFNTVLQTTKGVTNALTAEKTNSQKKEAPLEIKKEEPLEIIDTKIGDGLDGLIAHNGDMVEVHYTGWLYDAEAPDHKGRKFDSSLDKGKLYSFRLGDKKVIKGWDQGVLGMIVGGKRTLIIPSGLAYGSRGWGGGRIPPNAKLIFDIELFNIK